MNWKLVAWNGIQFECPEDWEINQLDSNFILIGDQAGPKMEIKWDRIRGKFDPQFYLVRLRKRFKEKNPGEATLTPIPVIWEKAVCRFESAGFMWQNDRSEGKGVLLYCRHCHRVILVQFYFENKIKNKRLHEKIIDSIRDHRLDDFLLWSVFGVQARIPKTFILTDHRIEAGIIELTFKKGNMQVKIFRWGPANILLSDKDLKTFAHEHFLISDSDMKTYDNNDSELEWITQTDLKWRIKIRALILSEPLFRRTRIWQNKDRNRIMGIHLVSSSPIIPGDFEHIYKHYETI